MRLLQTLFVLVIAYFLLLYLWPLLLLFLALIVYQLYKARRIFRQNFQQAQQDAQNKDFETFRQDNTNDDVIDANYTERSHTDGPQ